MNNVYNHEYAKLHFYLKKGTYAVTSNNYPGQLSMLQKPSSSSGPTQYLPLFLGSGPVHVGERKRLPTLQLFVQSNHMLHDVHMLSMAVPEKYKIRSITITTFYKYINLFE